MPIHKNLSAFLSLKMSVSNKATPSFFPPAAPAGITHYTFVPKVVCQRGLPPPLETPPALSEMGTHTGVPCGHISSKSAKQKRRELSMYDSRAALFCPPSALYSRRELPPCRVNFKQKYLRIFLLSGLPYLAI